MGELLPEERDEKIKYMVIFFSRGLEGDRHPSSPSPPITGASAPPRGVAAARLGPPRLPREPDGTGAAGILVEDAACPACPACPGS